MCVMCLVITQKARTTANMPFMFSSKKSSRDGCFTLQGMSKCFISMILHAALFHVYTR